MNKELIKRLEDKRDQQVKKLMRLYEEEKKTKQKIHQIDQQLNIESRKQ